MDKKAETEKERYTRLNKNPLYRYFTQQIWNTSGEIDNLKREIKRLADKQEELKRGRSALVKLRRDLVAGDFKAGK